MNVKRALVTGISGFTGQYLVQELLAAGYEVFGITQKEMPSKTCTFYVADLSNQQKLEEVIAKVNPSVVIHLAAISYVAHNDVAEIYHTNIVGTRNLLSALVSAGVSPRLVLIASSANIYGNSGLDVIDETHVAAPENDYALSKYAMELMAKQWRDKLPIVITRPFNYTGVGQSQRFLLPKIVSHFAKKCDVIELGNLDVYRDFSDVRTVARVYMKLIEIAPAGETYNVCSGKSYSLMDILNEMSKIAGYTIDVRVNPAFVRQNEVKRLTGSCNKLAELIGEIKPIHISETLAWMYRANVTK